MDNQLETQDTDEVVETPSDSSNDLQSETQLQEQEGVARLRDMPALTPEGWAQLDIGGRLEALNNVEATMAEIQGRPSVPVETAPMGETTFGGYDGSRILLNEEHLRRNELPVREFVDTIVHEGRHAYQDAAVKNPDLAGNAPEVQAWAENMQNYLSLEQYGQEIYQSQPVEADAWNYAAQITNGLYGSAGKE